MHIEHRKLRQNYYPILSAIIVRDGYGCAKCGSTRNIRVDHINPVRLGGLTEIDNLQLLCHRCNGIKGSSYADYRPNNRGVRGLKAPRFTAQGECIISVLQTIDPDDDFNAIYNDYVESAFLCHKSKSTMRVRILSDNSVCTVTFGSVLPSDLQHIIGEL